MKMNEDELRAVIALSAKDKEYRRKRLKRFSITPEFLLDLAGSDKWFRFQCESLPEDAEIMGVNASFESNCFHILVKSKEFDPVPEGEIIPLSDPLVVEFKKEPQHAED